LDVFLCICGKDQKLDEKRNERMEREIGSFTITKTRQKWYKNNTKPIQLASKTLFLGSFELHRETP